MRKIALDTETTGLRAAKGDRIIEIGCIEITEGAPARTFQTYVDPQFPISESAFAVHGISEEFLAGKPRFADIAEEFLEFVKGAELVIHNARFDVGFLDNELRLAGLPKLSVFCPKITDTMLIARKKLPNNRLGLDALCDHFGIDRSERTVHGALLDARLLSSVYLELCKL